MEIAYEAIHNNKINKEKIKELKEFQGYYQYLVTK
jgi:hypothetical protein